MGSYQGSIQTTPNYPDGSAELAKSLGEVVLDPGTEGKGQSLSEV